MSGRMWQMRSEEQAGAELDQAGLADKHKEFGFLLNELCKTHYFIVIFLLLREKELIKITKKN